MNIIMIPSWYYCKEAPTGGSFFKAQAEALVQAGHNVTILYCEVFGLKGLVRKLIYKEKSFVIDNGVRVYRTKKFSFFKHGTTGMHKQFAKAIRNLYRKNLLNEKIDLVHAQSCMWAGYAALKMKNEYNIPYVITEHSTVYSRGQINKKYLKLIKNIFNSANKVICVSQGLKDDLYKYTGRMDIEVIGNVVDTEKFKIRKENEYSKTFRFLTVCYLANQDSIYKKGIDILLKAFSNLINKVDCVELYIGGGGAGVDLLRSTAKELGIDKKVKFLGKLSREDVVKNMQECDAFVLPSRFETFGVVFIEALSCGKPVIATSSGGPDDFINELNGLLVNVENINGLTNAMQSIYINSKNYDEEKIREDCISKFSSNAISGKLTKVYLELIKL